MDSLFSFPVGLFHPLQHAGLSRRSLYRRSQFAHWAIGTCTFSALLTCLVIGLMFVGTELHFSPDRAISLMFVASMVSLIAGLLLFLAEVRLATGMLLPIQKASKTGGKEK